jgi:hypothetical protein
VIKRFEMRKGLNLLASLVLAAITLSCVSIAGDASFDEVARVASPDGRAEAILVETDGGATTSFGYFVFVVPKGVKLKERDDKYIVAKLYDAVRNQQAYGANLSWPSRDQLRIEYLSARSADLLEPQINFAGYDVKIELVGGVEDRSAPPGSMLQNRGDR